MKGSKGCLAKSRACDFAFGPLAYIQLWEGWVAMSTEGDNKQYNVWESTGNEDEIDQFQLLEEKVDRLIEKTMALKGEKEALAQKLREEEEKVADLNRTVKKLRSGRNDAKEKIMSLLEKMEQVSGWNAFLF